VVVYACNPRYCVEVEAGGLWVQSHSGQKLGRPYLKNKMQTKGLRACWSGMVLPYVEALGSILSTSKKKKEYHLVTSQ
jgi:hypothetical protein